jgi:hypothetical protein
MRFFSGCGAGRQELFRAIFKRVASGFPVDFAIWT